MVFNKLWTGQMLWLVLSWVGTGGIGCLSGVAEFSVMLRTSMRNDMTSTNG